MEELRQLLRYEIPGLLVFAYSTIITLFFIKSSELRKLVELVDVLSKLFIVLAIIALPVGWLLYQLYDICFYRLPYNHYTKPSVRLLKGWASEFIPREEINDKVCEELENFFFSYKENEKLKDNLNIYWNYYHARWITGFFVPIVSAILSIFGVLFLKFNYNSLLVEWKLISIRSVAFVVILIIILIFHVGAILWPTTRIRNEVDTLECLLLLYNKKEIDEELDNFFQKHQDTPYFQDFINELLKRWKKNKSLIEKIKSIFSP